MQMRYKILLGVVASILAAAILFDTIAKMAIETVGTRVLKVPVYVGSVSISPLRGGCRLRGLRVGNLDKYKEAYVLELGSLSVDWDWWSLLGSSVRVQSVTIDNLHVNLEGSLTMNNLTELQGNVKKPTKAEANQKEKEVVLGKLRLEDVSARWRAPAQEPMEISLPPMEFSNFSSRNPGVLVQRVTLILTERLLKEVALKVASGAVKEGLEAAGEQIGSGLKKLFGN